MNTRLGNLGETVIVTDPVEHAPEDPTAGLAELSQDMEADAVELLVMIGVNPVYDAPADMEFASRLDKVPTRIHLGLYENETARLCQWHIPEAHSLEAWSDLRAYDGTSTIVQPLIEPLYDGKSPHELLAALLGEPGASGHDIVRAHWESWHSEKGLQGEFERFWRKSLHDGFIAGAEAAPKQVTVAQSIEVPSTPPANGDLEILFRPDPTVWDGSFSNNGWMQELPKPLTKLTWDNAALVSPATAERLGLANEDVVDLTIDGRSVQAPVWIAPGHADDAVSVTLGYGRTRAGRVGDNAGFNASAIRSSANFLHAGGLAVRSTGRRHPLATTQEHHSMEGRHLVRSASHEAYAEDPHIFEHMGHRPGPEMTLYPGHKYEGYAWGMAIDLNSCTGCNACMVACTSENNTPVVGKDQVLAGREMHWIRVDRYYEGDLDDPETHHQPVMCQHCEDAPCEPVCPVGATVHSSEGLNDMVYNRCVGTRYCSNNCPYKVRRFNFFHYSDYETPSLKMMNNPDVTVRSRGVMEKCTYCVQRINSARIDAEKEDREIRDGEVVTACQSVCPAQAIVFGNINDPESRVSKLKADSRNYGLLEETGTRPRTSYLAKVTNHHPDLGRGTEDGGAHHG
jgi:molybdopterin-containing oxidoreductase family iron-sulfur binding subunit